MFKHHVVVSYPCFIYAIHIDILTFHIISHHVHASKKIVIPMGTTINFCIRQSHHLNQITYRLGCIVQSKVGPLISCMLLKSIKNECERSET